MQYSALISLLAVSGVLAAPHTRCQTDTSIRVLLTDSAGTDGEAGIAAAGISSVSGTSFAGFSTPPSNSGPFSSVNLLLGADFEQKDLRCQLLDEAGVPIVMNRGENTDVTFSDGGSGPWQFSSFHTVTSVQCNPSLPKAGATDFKLNTKLSNAALGTIDDNPLPSGGSFSITTGFGVLYDTVELEVGQSVQNQESRCQVLDLAGSPLIVLRGTNRDTTFSDADKGEWTFEVGATEVSKVVCDPSFVANNLNAA